MGKRVDVMVDIETLGKGSDAAIFQIAAVAFDIETGKHKSKFNKIANIEEETHLRVDGSTLKWWLNTDKELLTNLLNKGKGSCEDLLTDFYHWLKAQSNDQKDIHLWGNGIMFDNKMIQHQLEEAYLDYPIYYKNDRDVRTIVDLAGKKLGISEKELKDRFNDESLVKHDAYDDVTYQINLVVSCYELLIK